jgi:hypothetical protein
MWNFFFYALWFTGEKMPFKEFCKTVWRHSLMRESGVGDISDLLTAELGDDFIDNTEILDGLLYKDFEALCLAARFERDEVKRSELDAKLLNYYKALRRKNKNFVFSSIILFSLAVIFPLGFLFLFFKKYFILNTFFLMYLPILTIKKNRTQYYLKNFKRFFPKHSKFDLWAGLFGRNHFVTNLFEIISAKNKLNYVFSVQLTTKESPQRVEAFKSTQKDSLQDDFLVRVPPIKTFKIADSPLFRKRLENTVLADSSKQYAVKELHCIEKSKLTNFFYGTNNKFISLITDPFKIEAAKKIYDEFLTSKKVWSLYYKNDLNSDDSALEFKEVRPTKALELMYKYYDCDGILSYDPRVIYFVMNGLLNPDDYYFFKHLDVSTSCILKNYADDYEKNNTNFITSKISRVEFLKQLSLTRKANFVEKIALEQDILKKTF